MTRVKVRYAARVNPTMTCLNLARFPMQVSAPATDRIERSDRVNGVYFWSGHTYTNASNVGIRLEWRPRRAINWGASHAGYANVDSNYSIFVVKVILDRPNHQALGVDQDSSVGSQKLYHKIIAERRY